MAFQIGRDIHPTAMTQPLDINNLANTLAMETIAGIQSAMSKLSTEKDAEKQRFVNRLAKALDDLTRHKAALKVATDALKQCKKYAGEYKTEWIAEDALTQIEKELKP